MHYIRRSKLLCNIFIKILLKEVMRKEMDEGRWRGLKKRRIEREGNEGEQKNGKGKD
jgi:hypothetical protein